MRQQLAAYLNNAIFALILGIVVLTPLIFTPLTTEFFETPKVILLVVGVLVLAILVGLYWVVQGKVVLTRTPLDLPLLLLLIVVLVSTYLSDSRYVSIFGNAPRIHGSAITWVAYTLFYFIAVWNIRGASQIRTMVYALLGSALIVALASLLSYFGLYLPFNFAKVANFTPAGSSFSATALLVLLLPLLSISIIRPDRFLSPVVSLVLTTIFGIVIVLSGTLATQIAAALVIAAIVFFSNKNDVRKSVHLLAIPVVVSLVIFALGYVNLGKVNPLMQKRNDFPREIQLGIVESWKVAVSSFRDKPFFGSGPSTFLFNFTTYKPVDFNGSRYWNLRFDTAFNEFFQILGTLGLLGTLGFLFFAAMLISFAAKGLKHRDNNLVFGLSISILIAFIMMLLHVSTPVLMVSIFALLAIMMGLHKSGGGKVEELTLGIKASKIREAAGDFGSFNNLVAGDVLPIILFIPILILSLIAAYQTYRAVAADVYHRKALNAANQRALDTYNNLVAAENLNPRIDLYRVDLAQTNFALANAIAINKRPTEASPGGALTDQDKANIQQLLSQSVAEARVAVALSPRSPQNWEILASIYRQISGVAQNALAFSLDAYGRAIQMDPLNPLLRLNVGGVYYSVRNYDLAVRFFSDAVNLKPDYANAWYNLAVALRDKGDLNAAQQASERVVSILSKDTNNPDYKTASEFLTDLKARIATGSAQQSQIKPPAAQENGALQQQNLPKVDVEGLKEQPENIATPPAVKKQ